MHVLSFLLPKSQLLIITQILSPFCIKKQKKSKNIAHHELANFKLVLLVVEIPLLWTSLQKCSVSLAVVEKK